MRRVSYGSRGRPSTMALDIEELVLILQGAIESVDAERFILERDQAVVPHELQNFARNESYEVSVVGKFHTLAQRWLERQGLAAVWERPVAHRSAGKGRHPTVDISLFGKIVSEKKESCSTQDEEKVAKREIRLEFGFFQILSPKRLRNKRVDFAKLQSDADKLYSLRATATPVAGDFIIENFILLWRIANEKNTSKNLSWHQQALADSALEAMKQSINSKMNINHLLTSSVDLIAARKNEHRVVYVGAFQVAES
ncbi:hypothetical protein PTW37_03600 [Arthrobacter agilis]|uniref:hypothetical protein n=1 Tax=Arthrobacter agilis TaxID=37921 RepID=UPI0023654C9C|nr:hypothetical protein [Arthrobacter agilis]WDF34023.1 hypothetical protein PTW37_03600 [Arthrobacter agilis]